MLGSSVRNGQRSGGSARLAAYPCHQTGYIIALVFVQHLTDPVKLVDLHAVSLRGNGRKFEEAE
ncbi:hypothetical protein RQ479_25445 [Mesorhizobium sp. ISC25]|uniref:hypothetical protein n=1 Tax=Mesorhizobium sp. ISC25 TaxID=3077335 RepID=UPI0035D8B551